MLSIEELTAAGCEVLQNEPTRNHCSFRIGGNADYFIVPHSEQALSEAYLYLKKENVPFVVLGNGTNTLFSDDGIRGVVLCLTGGLTRLELTSEETVFCDAGVLLVKLCTFAAEHSLSGLEFAYGIPGSVGGAVFMNAGAYGGEMKSVIEKVRFLNSKGQYEEKTINELHFSYRDTDFMRNNCIVTGVYLRLKKSSRDDISCQMSELLAKRKNSQPLEFPSAGSTFKRPKEGYAAAHIEQCGLKGTAIGGAKVSEKHAGFVINTGNATARDVLSLMEFIQKTVFEQHGILLEPEVCMLGFD